MGSHRSLRFPITLSVIMIVLLAALIVGWVLMGTFSALADRRSAGAYWTALSLGSVFFGAVIVGVVLYLVWSIGMIRLHRRQTNFLDSVTHELKSPVSSLKLCVQTLSRGNLNAHQADDFHRFMLEDIERLDAMIDHVLEAARMDAPTAPTGDVTDLPAVLRECARSVCEQRRVPVDTVRLDLHPCAAQAAHADLALIFRNVIDNAVKYAGRPPEVTVTLRVAHGRYAVVCVADNGPGIPRKQRRRVFSRFVRVGDELERKRPGTGLGLYIVRTLVRRHRGRVCVSEGSTGAGTVLEIRLPCVTEAPSRVSRSESLDTAPALEHK